MGGRIQRGRWRRLSPGRLRDQYEDIHRRLGGGGPAQTSLNYLHRFACLANDDGSADLQGLNGTWEGSKRAERAWVTMQAEGQCWEASGPGAAPTRTGSGLCGRIVGVHCESQCEGSRCPVPTNCGRSPVSALGCPCCQQPPLLRSVWFEATRSYERTFDLHGCLPLRVRRLGPANRHYRLLHRIVDEMAGHLQSVSKLHLQKMALFLDHLVFDANQDVAEGSTDRGLPLPRHRATMGPPASSDPPGLVAPTGKRLYGAHVPGTLQEAGAVHPAAPK